MFRMLAKIIALGILVVAGSIAIVFYRDHYSADHQIAALELEKRQLELFVQRLTSERRVAQILVTDQKQVNGVLQTTLMFKELSPDGSPLPFKSFTIEGNEGHIDAMVIKFDHEYVERNDLLRGHSIALFTRLYGSQQTPAQGFPIDEPGKIPDFYRDSNLEVGAFESQLWTDFWKLADDAGYRREQGVRVAGGQGLWAHFETGRIYTITIESSGGLNLTSEPIEGPYQDVLNRHGPM